MRCDICGEAASYVVNHTLPLCEDCFTSVEDDLDGSEIVEYLEDDTEDEDDGEI